MYENERGSGLTNLLVVLVIFIVGAGIVMHLSSSHPSESEELAARQSELRKAIVLAGTPLVDHPGQAAMDYNAQAARLTALHSYSDQKFSNPELTKIWSQIDSQVDEGLLILERIAKLDTNTPSGYDLVAKALQADDDDQQKKEAFENELAEWARLKLDKINMEERFRSVDDRLNNSIAELQGVANGVFPHDTQSGVSIEYLPSWDGRFWGDEVEITNTSGSSMDNVPVVITAHMPDGSSRVHLHYADHWQSGTTLRALYPYEATDYANAQAGGNPASVDVAVYTTTGTAQAAYALTQEAWDQRVKAYCSRLTFSGNYLAPYVESDSNQQYHAGYQFQFTGLPNLPVRSVEVKFTASDGSVEDAVWTPEQTEKLREGQTLPLRSELLDLGGQTPSHIEYIVSFAGTGYQQDVPAY